MGCQNGSFVRSHKRERLTHYDPRNRPWYINAIHSPEQTVITNQYPSVMTEDNNIGIGKALVDGTDKMYGAIRVGITPCPVEIRIKLVRS